MLFYTEQWYRYFVIHQRMFSKLFVNSKQATDGTSKKIQHFIQESSCTSPFLVPFLCWLSKYWTLQNQVITAESLFASTVVWVLSFLREVGGNQFIKASPVFNWCVWISRKTHLLSRCQLKCCQISNLRKSIFSVPWNKQLIFPLLSPPQTFVGCFRTFNFSHEFQ